MTSTSNNITDWTHKGVTITDIRMFSKLYAVVIDDPTIKTPLFINGSIFEERLSSYFMKMPFTREDVLDLKWNMYITKGYFIKIDQFGNVDVFHQHDKEKWFVSFLEIAGPLGTFDSVYKMKREQNDK